MTDSRIIVAIEFVNGGRAQAVCRTQGCTAGEDGGPWRGGAYSRHKVAGFDADWHRQSHRRQLDQAVAGA